MSLIDKDNKCDLYCTDKSGNIKKVFMRNEDDNVWKEIFFLQSKLAIDNGVKKDKKK